MQWWEDRDDWVIDNTVRLFNGEPAQFKTDWPAIVFTFGWLSLILMASLMPELG